MMFVTHAKKLCDVIGFMDDSGMWVIIAVCLVNNGIFAQNERARRSPSCSTSVVQVWNVMLRVCNLSSPACLGQDLIPQSSSK